jgi:hypothetical protein
LLQTGGMFLSFLSTRGVILATIALFFSAGAQAAV